MDKLYRVAWCKTYYATGSAEITAGSKEEAEDLVNQEIGDLTGSLQYDPDKDEVVATEVELLEKEDQRIRFLKDVTSCARALPVDTEESVAAMMDAYDTAREQYPYADITFEALYPLTRNAEILIRVPEPFGVPLRVKVACSDDEDEGWEIIDA